MVTGTVTRLYCVQPSTGTDLGSALAGLGNLLPAQLGFDPMATIGNLIAALDRVQANPDDLYITKGAKGNANALWPGPGKDIETYRDQTHSLNLPVQFSGSQNLTLWDRDSSPDDPLGSITMLETERGWGELAKVAVNPQEGSVYYVLYRVD